MPRGGGGGGVTACRCGGLHGLAGGPSGLARPVAGGGGGVACARLSRFFQYCSLSGVGRPSRPCCWYESATPPLASRLRCCLRADHHEGDSAMMAVTGTVRQETSQKECGHDSWERGVKDESTVGRRNVQIGVYVELPFAATTGGFLFLRRASRCTCNDGIAAVNFVLRHRA